MRWYSRRWAYRGRPCEPDSSARWTTPEPTKEPWPPATASRGRYRHREAMFYVKCDSSRLVFSLLVLRSSRLILKRHARGNGLDQRLGPVIILSQFRHDGIYCTGILERQAAPQRVAEHLAGQVANEQILPFE